MIERRLETWSSKGQRLIHMVNNAKSDKTAQVPAIQLTAGAIAEVRRRMSAQADPDKKLLRIWVEAGGCSGLSYEMEFVKDKQERDFEFNFDGLTVLVESRSMPYITGMTLDYSDQMVNGGFQFSNPKAKRSCGCGTSFSV